ncbi:hypothetical protein MRX96_011334 [Rhipicephalus microplus]
MATAQQDDSEIQVLRLQEIFLKLENVQLPGCAITFVCDTSTGCPRPYVPAPFHRESSTPCIPCRTPVYVRISASSQGDIYGLV